VLAEVEVVVREGEKLGVVMEDVDGMPTVVRVDEMSAAFAKGVRVGHCVISVNDSPAGQRKAADMRARWKSTPGTKTMRFAPPLSAALQEDRQTV